MKVRGISGLVAFCLTCIAAAWTPAAEPAIRIHAGVREFAVTVSPTDEESRNAESSVLYQRRNAEDDWKNIGLCEKHVRENGDVRFTRDVYVDDDGLYYFTSRPVVGGEVTSPPERDSLPQAIVVVDTLPPFVEFVSLADEAEFVAGKAVAIGWRAEDENLVDRPVALVYSPDGGRSWLGIAADLRAAGELEWTSPADLRGTAILRLTAADRAGNIGRAVRRVEMIREPPASPPPPPPPPAKEPEPEPELEPAPTPPETASAPIPPPAEILEAPVKEVVKARDSNRSWLYYLMAVNLMRQNKPKDALQYYWLAVREDPDFIEAWADIALAYIDVGAYRTARDVVEQTRDKDPERIDLMHLLGETYHAEGMDRLGRATSPEDRQEAKGLIDLAVEWYGRALEAAADEWRLAERAPSYYRLGEICYYVNMDRDGARAYWRKILDLHSPTPNPDLILWTAPDKRDRARARHQRYTYNRVALEAWQNWARGYLEQLDARERKGILDLMPAQRLNSSARQSAQGYVCDDDDSRSLFSLPSQYGDSSGKPAGTGASAPPSARAASASGASEDYSFYAPKGGGPENHAAGDDKGSSRKPRGMFSGGPDRSPPPNPDPYAFPRRGRATADWMGSGPYGDKPVADW